jgi:hypothetical protein
VVRILMVSLGDKNTCDPPVKVEFQGGRHSGMYAFSS